VRPSPEPSLPEGTGKHTADGLGKYNVSSNHSEKEGPGHRAPWSPDWYPDGELIELCRDGLVNEYVDIQGDGGDSDVCCPPKCGMCGGPMCRERPGAATSCCVEDIERSHVYCEVESDMQCIMPLTCTEDPCMVHCPLNPGCSVIWKNRGRNYEEMRQKLSVPEQGLRVAPSRAQLVQAQSQIAEAHAQIALLATDSADTRVAGLRLKTRLAVLKASEAKSNTLAPSFDPKTCKAKKGKNKMATDEWCETNCGDGDAPLCPLELCLCAPNAALPSHAVPPAEQNDAPKEPRKEEPEQPAMQLQHVERAARADHRQPSRAS